MPAYRELTFCGPLLGPYCLHRFLAHPKLSSKNYGSNWTSESQFLQHSHPLGQGLQTLVLRPNLAHGLFL